MFRLASTALIVLFASLITGCGTPSSGDAAVTTAMNLYEEREFAQAIPHLENALDQPLRLYTRSEVLTTIGNCYNELGEYERSLLYHDQALEADPNNHQAFVNKGIVFRLQGEFSKAEQAYSKALEMAPDYAELHASLGALAIHQGKNEEAVLSLERAVKLDDQLAVAHSNLAYAYASVGRFDEAESELANAVRLGYHQPEVILERINEFRQAMAEQP